jgi:hypothetical protein
MTKPIVYCSGFVAVLRAVAVCSGRYLPNAALLMRIERLVVSKILNHVDQSIRRPDEAARS